MRSKTDFYEDSDILSSTVEKPPKLNKNEEDNTKQIKIKKKSNNRSIDLKSPQSGPLSNSDNLDFLSKQVDGNNLNDVIDNLIVNTNTNVNKSNSNIFSGKNSVANNDGELSIKKQSLNSSLFKAGESIIGSQFSGSIKNSSSETGALKKVNERLRYLEKLEKESSLNLNKQKEKIKSKNLKKEEEMKKKIEDVRIFLFIFVDFLLIFY